MPKNQKKRKNTKNNKHVTAVRSILFKDENQEYARVENMCGDRRVKLHCFDGKNRIGKIRGKMRKRCWINPGDIVLYSLRDFNEKTVDIIHKYNEDEVRKLKQSGELKDKGEDKKEESKTHFGFVFEKEDESIKAEIDNFSAFEFI